MTRSNFENDLKLTHDKLIDMGNYVEAAIEDSIKAFVANDKELCRVIIDNDVKVDDMEKDLESKCLWLIARQQPIASDLRKITAALKIITDLERIGDHAADIAEITLQMKTNKPGETGKHILQMAKAAAAMVHDALNAYVNYDGELAKATRAKDDIVDEYFEMIKQELVGLFKKQPDDLDDAIDLLLIVKYLERIGDHAVNICDWVYFAITGKHKDALVF